MRFFLTIAILLGIIGISVFGVWAMNNGHTHNHGGCIAAAAKGVDCPKGGTDASISFHLDVLRSFSQATIQQDVWAGVLWVLLAAVTILLSAAMRAAFFSYSSLPFSVKRRDYEIFSLPLRLQFHHWLSFHEHSPTVD